MTATLSLFPLLGRTPPPWRWPADVMATANATHAAYVVPSRRWMTCSVVMELSRLLNGCGQRRV